MLTHTLYDGGICVVPDDRVLEAREKLAADCTNTFEGGDCQHSPAMVSEYCTMITRFYLDFDFISPYEQIRPQPGAVELPAESHLTFAQTILFWIRRCQAIVRRCFPLEPPESERLLCIGMRSTRHRGSDKHLKDYELWRRTTLVQGSDQKEQVYKYGVHLVFPNLYVDREQMLLMRQMCVDDFSQHYGELGPWEGHRHLGWGVVKDFSTNYRDFWDKTIDDGIYGRSPGTGGLRMPGMLKMKKCSDCKGASRIPSRTTTVTLARPQCPTCGHNGRIIDPWFYVPSHYVDGKGNSDGSFVDKLNEDTQLLVEQVSLRTPEVTATPGFQVPTGYHLQEKNQLPPRPSRRVESCDIGTGGDELVNEVQKFLRSWAPPGQKQPLWNTEAGLIFVRKIQLRAENIRPRGNAKDVGFLEFEGRVDPDLERNEGTFHVEVEGPGSHLCTIPNPPKHHNSSVIYFTLHLNTGVRQWCWSRSCQEPGKRPGSTQPGLIPQQLCRLLWPNWWRNTQHVQREILTARQRPTPPAIDTVDASKYAPDDRMGGLWIRYCKSMKSSILKSSTSESHPQSRTRQNVITHIGFEDSHSEKTAFRRAVIHLSTVNALTKEINRGPFTEYLKARKSQEEAAKAEQRSAKRKRTAPPAPSRADDSE